MRFSRVKRRLRWRRRAQSLVEKTSGICASKFSALVESRRKDTSYFNIYQFPPPPQFLRLIVMNLTKMILKKARCDSTTSCSTYIDKQIDKHKDIYVQHYRYHCFCWEYSLRKVLIRHWIRLVSVFRQYYESLECYKTHTAACPDIIASMKPVIENRKNQVGKECKTYEVEMLKKYTTTTTTVAPEKPKTSRLN